MLKRIAEKYHALIEYAQENVSRSVIEIIRIGLGILMIYEGQVFKQIGLLERGYYSPQFLFKFSGFEWVKLLPEYYMELLLWFMIIGGIFLVLGIAVRITSILLCLLWFYIIFLEASYYNNHYYFFALLLFWFSVFDTGKKWSIKTFYKSNSTVEYAPRWYYLVLQFQLAVVYFYGGLAKLNYDWLVRFEPVRSMLKASKSDWVVDISELDWVVGLVNYGGLFLDLFIVIILLNKRLRIYGVLLVLVFNLLNAFWFDDIGAFPFVMIFLTILFFYDKFSVQNDTSDIIRSVQLPAYGKWIIGGYIIFQLLFPGRAFLLPNNPIKTGIAKNFSWRMKSHTKKIEKFECRLFDKDKGETFLVDVNTYINNKQIDMLAVTAKMMWDLANYIEMDYTARNGIDRSQVEIYITCNLIYNNSAEPIEFVDRKRDLTNEEFLIWKKNDWY